MHFYHELKLAILLMFDRNHGIGIRFDVCHPVGKGDLEWKRVGCFCRLESGMLEGGRSNDVSLDLDGDCI